MSVVTFDVTAFRAAYPQFSKVTDAQLNNFFSIACLILDNTDSSPVADTTERSVLLNLLVCHFSTLYLRGSLSGALSSASEGSVSTGFTPPPFTHQNWWYLQTPCGAAYWQATLKYRSGGRYFAYVSDH